MKFQEIVSLIRTLFECSLSIFFIVHKMRRRVTRDGAICAKKNKFNCFDEASPIIEKAIQLQSPTPILAPGSDCFRSLVTMSYQ